MAVVNIRGNIRVNTTGLVTIEQLESAIEKAKYLAEGDPILVKCIDKDIVFKWPAEDSDNVA